MDCGVFFDASRRARSKLGWAAPATVESSTHATSTPSPNERKLEAPRGRGAETTTAGRLHREVARQKTRRRNGAASILAALVPDDEHVVAATDHPNIGRLAFISPMRRSDPNAR